MTITDADTAYAGKYPALGRPEYGTLYTKRKPDEFPRGPIFHSGNLRGLLEAHCWCPGKNWDPLTQALHAAGPIPAEQYAFRMMEANFRMGRPLVGGACHVWTLPERLIQIPGQRDWRPGARLGEDADGSWARKATTLTSTPPAARKA